jgi:hypothetical protein
VTEESRTPPTEPASIDDVLARETQDVEEEVSKDQLPGASEGERPTALDTEGANSLAAERRPTVLVLAGAVGTGKTSVYAAIYERLGRGEFAGWMFAGSRTIAGLEERCFWWRTASGSASPDMPATSGNALPWLHVRLRDAELRWPAKDLLLGDFDGERFQQVRDGVTDPRTLPFLRRADHVGVVIDGARIADETSRVAEGNDVMNLLKELRRPEVVATERSLLLVVTKVDEFERLSDTPRREANDFLKGIHRETQEVLGFEIDMLRLAVRSMVPEFPLGHGLESLLERLLVVGPVYIQHPPAPYQPSSALGRFRG